MFPRKLHGFNFIEETDDGEIGPYENIKTTLVRVYWRLTAVHARLYLLRSVMRPLHLKAVVTTTKELCRIFYMADNLVKNRFILILSAQTFLPKVKAEKPKKGGLYDSDMFSETTLAPKNLNRWSFCWAICCDCPTQWLSNGGNPFANCLAFKKLLAT